MLCASVFVCASVCVSVCMCVCVSVSECFHACTVYRGDDTEYHDGAAGSDIQNRLNKARNIFRKLGRASLGLISTERNERPHLGFHDIYRTIYYNMNNHCK